MSRLGIRRWRTDGRFYVYFLKDWKAFGTPAATAPMETDSRGQVIFFIHDQDL